MLALPELQREFRSAILTGDPGALAGVVEGDGLPPAARLQIYRNHVLDSLTEVLQATYPVVCRLVDERFFGYAADQYIRSDPPAGPCLFEYGETFPSFLERFPPCRDLAYLPDVARLEWAVNVALHAEDVPAVAVAALEEIPAVGLPGLRLRLHPSLSLHASPWPVDLIWRANQPDREPAGIVDLGAGGACLEVRRSGDDVVLRRLDAATFALRLALRDGGSLEDAAAAASAADSGFDFGAALSELFGEGMVVGFEISTPDEGDDVMATRAAYAETMPGVRGRIAVVLEALRRVPLAFHQLLFRLAIAGVFTKAGVIKITSWETTVQLFRDEYRVPLLSPEFAARMAATFELGCSALLIAGLLTRVATLPLLGMIMTIQLFVYPDAWSDHLVWGSILLFLLTRGPGSISVDRLIGLEPSERPR